MHIQGVLVASISTCNFNEIKYFFSYPGSCDFENGDFCNWKNNLEAGSISWLINSGSTPTTGTGPDFDQTFGTSLGQYIYLEASSQEKGQLAVLESEPMKNNEEGCLFFWYHMFGGQDMGTLNVYLKSTNSRQLLWSLTGKQGYSWLQGLAPYNSNELHQLQFEGSVGSNELSDIALDG